MADSNSNPGLPQEKLVSRLIAARGFSLEELEPSLDSLPDEALFANIDVVAQRLRRAVFQNEPMVIFGHDDPDG
jgi:single-stranded DNA-specific DHH superfamily exonuclease